MDTTKVSGRVVNCGGPVTAFVYVPGMPFNVVTDANGRFSFFYMPAPAAGQPYDVAVQLPGQSPQVFSGAISFAAGDADVVLEDFILSNTSADPNNCGACGNVCPNGSACVNSACTAPAAHCGNAVIEAGEQCDDGNSNNQDACTNACTIPVCGDGITSGLEQCDDGNFNNTDACLSTCVVAACGDGVLRQGVEQCDDGNAANGDGCSAACLVEVAQNVCGDGQRGGTEQCDDANSNNQDSCTNACTLAQCGDAITSVFEQCDDGNSSNTDACTSVCTVNVCGDGFVRAGVEQCDDGNLVNGDSCSATCQVEGSGPAVVFSSAPIATRRR